jgi:hypothetical protein
VSVNGRACVKRRPVRLSRVLCQRSAQAGLNPRDVLQLFGGTIHSVIAAMESAAESHAAAPSLTRTAVAAAAGAALCSSEAVIRRTLCVSVALCDPVPSVNSVIRDTE